MKNNFYNAILNNRNALAFTLSAFFYYIGLLSVILCCVIGLIFDMALDYRLIWICISLAVMVVANRIEYSIVIKEFLISIKDKKA